jgi:hypothetical protein
MPANILNKHYKHLKINVNKGGFMRNVISAQQLYRTYLLFEDI